MTRAIFAVLVGAGLVATGIHSAAPGDEREPPEGPAGAVSAGHAPPDSAIAETNRTRSDAVTDVAELISQFDEGGFGDIRTHHDKQAVTVLWNGEPPQAVLDLAAKGLRGVRLAIEPATYTRDELTAGSTAIYRSTLRDELGVMFVEQDVEKGLTVGTSRAKPFTDSALQLLRQVSQIDAITVEYDVPPVTGY